MHSVPFLQVHSFFLVIVCMHPPFFHRIPFHTLLPMHSFSFINCHILVWFIFCKSIHFIHPLAASLHSLYLFHSFIYHTLPPCVFVWYQSIHLPYFFSVNSTYILQLFRESMHHPIDVVYCIHIHSSFYRCGIPYTYQFKQPLNEVYVSIHRPIYEVYLLVSIHYSIMSLLYLVISLFFVFKLRPSVSVYFSFVKFIDM